MKLPNGYGSITKLSGKRRKPYMVRISGSVIWNEEKQDYKQERVVLGYYKDRKSALQALSDYNDSPYSLQDNNSTFADLWEEWKKSNYPKLSSSSTVSKDSAYKYCSPISDIRIRDITIDMLDHVIDGCTKSSSTKKNIKTVMSAVFQLALRKNLVVKDLSRQVKIEASEPTFERIIYSSEEINILWKNQSKWQVRVLLVLLYTGMRVNEFLKNDLANFDLDKSTIYIPSELAKNKTSIRTIPIHEKIFPIIKDFYDTAIQCHKEKIAVNDKGTVITYNNFVSRELPKMNELTGTVHRLHDTRHTFVSRCTELNLKEVVLQKIIGHEADNIMRKVYTHISVEEMTAEINKLKY